MTRESLPILLAWNEGIHCDICGEPFIAKQCFIFEGFLMHENCYRTFSSRSETSPTSATESNNCFLCGGIGAEKTLEFKGIAYHFHKECTKCFVCASHLDHSNFVIVKDRAVCKSCYEDSTKNLCCICGDPTLRCDSYSIKGHSIHLKCFKCSLCGIDLRLQNVATADGKLFCEACQGIIPHLSELDCPHEN